MTLISTLNILEYKTKMMGKKDGAYPKSIGLQVILMLVCLIYIVWNKYLKKGINYVDIFVCFSIIIHPNMGILPIYSPNIFD